MPSTRKAVFIGRDGTLTGDCAGSPDCLNLATGAATGLPLLHAAGYRLIVASNEPGIARGSYRESAMAGVESRLRDMLSEIGVPLAGFYFCPHHPDGIASPYARSCRCRKPRAGMLHQAALEQRIDLGASWMIGDLLDDVETAHQVGSRAALIDNGREREWRTDDQRRPDCIATDLAEAALIIASWARGGIRA
jgi:D-glycero-D-manno-heptose 1,7-bisphosphate phosphatase